VLTLLPLESSGYQCQDKINHPQQHFSFLGDIQKYYSILFNPSQPASQPTQIAV
jgi:hypothetical protein